MTVLVWGLRDDPQVQAVMSELAAAGADAVLLDQRAGYRVDNRYEARPADEAGAAIRLDDARAAFVRSWDALDVPEVRLLPEDSKERRSRLSADAHLWSWLHHTRVPVVNRPIECESNCSKPLQAAWAARCGFAIPETLITTEPDEAWHFLAEHDQIVYKSISARRSVVGRLSVDDPEDDLRARLRSVRWCPTQFQRWIAGTDYRVHVFGPSVYTCRIDCAGVDYRYDPSGTTVISPAELPDEVARRCVDLTRTLGLLLGGVDLRHGPDDRWYCFEVNPYPAFSYFESETGLPLARTLTALLCDPQLCTGSGA